MSKEKPLWIFTEAALTSGRWCSGNRADFLSVLRDHAGHGGGISHQRGINKDFGLLGREKPHVNYGFLTVQPCFSQ